MRLLLWLFLAAAAQAASPLLLLRNEQLPSPGAVGASGAQASATEKGNVWMIWTEPAEAGATAVRTASFDPERHVWTEPITVASGPEISVNGFSTPQIAADDDGNVCALWFVRAPSDGSGEAAGTRAMVSRSGDSGKTWPQPAPLSRESEAQEFASLAALGEGQFIAAWLDGRNAHRPGGAQALYGRDIFSHQADALIDPRVCDCCATSVVGYPDGTARVVYRARSEDDVREIFTARRVRDRWTTPTPLSHGHWQIHGCPVNGPSLSASGPRTAAAWFTAEDGQPRVFAALSATAGEPFLMAARVDDGHALGQVGAATLEDGTSFVSWIEAADVKSQAWLLLRRLLPDGSLSVPVRLAALSAGRATGVPRILPLRGKTPGKTRLLVAYTAVEGGIPHLVTRLLAVEPPSPERTPCASCPPDETRGHAVHGHILSIDTQERTVRVKHDEIPGVMPAMTMRFHVPAGEIDALHAPSEIRGRIEQREDGWWLFAIRTVPAK